MCEESERVGGRSVVGSCGVGEKWSGSCDEGVRWSGSCDVGVRWSGSVGRRKLAWTVVAGAPRGLGGGDDLQSNWQN